MSKPTPGPTQRRAIAIATHNEFLDQRLQQLFTEIKRISSLQLKADRMIFEAPEISIADELLNDQQSVYSNKLETEPDQALMARFRACIRAGI